jgi:hypothetical protein
MKQKKYTSKQVAILMLWSIAAGVCVGFMLVTSKMGMRKWSAITALAGAICMIMARFAIS